MANQDTLLEIALILGSEATYRPCRDPSNNITS